MRSSVVQRNQEAGLFVGASDAFIEATTIRDTITQLADGLLGSAISVMPRAETGERSSLQLQRSSIVANSGVGVFIGGSDATISLTAVHDTRPDGTGRFGTGIAVQEVPSADAAPATCTVIATSVARSQHTGMVVFGAQLTLEDSVVTDTANELGGLFGDGLAVLRTPSSDATAVVRRCVVAGSERAGIANFGASLQLDTTALSCNAIPLNGERAHNTDAKFDDLGNNDCGCGPQAEPCKAISAGVAPPAPLEPPASSG
ncbi:MAG: hypothetical protein JRI68_31720 [Deltaproteobacteria bacterium]|nr:hypothetical protein [Deltaproteobacteria bacterium]